jgi:DNA-binding transcriptional LysR family regulator
LRSLEGKLGVRLVSRTTRTVALTEAGSALLRQIGPAFASIETAVETINDFRDHPTGTIRISVPRTIAARVLTPMFRAFTDRYPDVTLEVAADNAFVDIIKQGFDAGIRLGKSLERDMIAVRVTPSLNAAVVASPTISVAFRRLRRRAICTDIAVSAGVSPEVARSIAGSSKRTGGRSMLR